MKLLANFAVIISCLTVVAVITVFLALVKIIRETRVNLEKKAGNSDDAFNL